MPVKYESMRFSNWAGGLNRSLSDFEINDNELWTAENCLLDSAAMVKRKGYAELNGTALVAGTEVLSVFVYGDYILANCGEVIFSITTAGVVAEVVTGLTEGYPVSYAVYDGVVYMTNGKDNPWKWDGALAAVDLGAGLPKAKWFVLHRDKLFYIATIAAPNYVYFSQAGSPETIDADAFFIVYTDDNQELTGGASLYGYLMLFKESSTHKLGGTTKQQLTLSSNLVSAHPRIGCVAANTIAHVPGGLMFLSNDGVQFTDTVNIVKQSDNVGYFLNKIVDTNKEWSAGFWDGKNYRFGYPTGTSTYPSESLVYGEDGIRNALGTKELHTPWSLFTYGMNCYSRSLSGVIYAASSAGHVYIIDSGLSDNGTDIDMRVTTKVFDFGAPWLTKAFRFMGMNVYRSAGTPEFTISIDRGVASYLKILDVATGLTFWRTHNWATSSGTVTVTDTTANVSGDVDADWTNVVAGDLFQVDGDDDSYIIDSVNIPAKTLILTTDYDGTTGAGNGYVIWDADTLFWIDATPQYEEFSLPKRVKGSCVQLHIREVGDDSEVEVYSLNLRFVPKEGAR